EERRLRHADPGIGGDQAIFRLPNVGPSLEERPWQSRRNGWRKGLPDERPASADRTRVAPEQDTEEVLRLRDLPLEIWNLSGRARELGLRLTEVQCRGQPRLKAVTDELERPATRVHAPRGGLELQIELAEPEVRGGYVADGRHPHRVPGRLAGQKLGPCRLGRPPQATPDVELERGVERGLEV